MWVEWAMMGLDCCQSKEVVSKAYGGFVGHGCGMLRMDKILVGTEETVVVTVGRLMDRSPGDCMESREY